MGKKKLATISPNLDRLLGRKINPQELNIKISKISLS